MIFFIIDLFTSFAIQKFNKPKIEKDKLIKNI